MTESTTESSCRTTQQQQQDEARRLFVGNLPKAKTDKDICEEVRGIAPGLVRVITYKNFDDPALHRGFCFLDYESAAAAADAMRALSARTVFGCRIVVDWADPEPDADDGMMAAVRILFVRQHGGDGGAMLDEAAMAAAFGRHGEVERVKNLKNYSFVHFAHREHADAAMRAMDGTVDAATGVRLDVSWAKPPADRRVRERMLRDRERRMRRTTTTSLSSLSSLSAAAVAAMAAETAAAAGHGFGSEAVPGAAAAAAPYGSYDHYAYEFGRTTRRQYDCPCGAEVEVRSTNDDADDFDDWAPTIATAAAAAADAGAPRHDHGDWTNLDEKVLTFFRNMSTSEVKRD